MGVFGSNMCSLHPHIPSVPYDEITKLTLTADDLFETPVLDLLWILTVP